MAYGGGEYGRFRCAVYVCLRRARTVPGAFYAAPEPLTRFLMVSGAYRLGFADPAPLLRPRSGSAVPLEGEVPGDFSLGLPLVGVRKERLALVGSSLLIRAPALSRPLTRSASLAA